MNLLRDDQSELRRAIDAASDRLGLAPLFVEKDYWVTQVVRALHDWAPGAFLFKGGTSLSKGYGLIERFSEDVDILVQPAKEDSINVRERRLIAMAEAVESALGTPREETRPPGRGQMPHRADRFTYPEATSVGVGPPGGRSVLLETGFAGGEWPAEMVNLQPMLSETLEIQPGEFDDLEPFEIRALAPARTLIEKLALLHHVASRFSEDAVVTDDRFGRHYYDVYCLLSHGPTLNELSDRGQFERILGEMQVISARHYGGWSARPQAGYAGSPAFAPPRDSELRDWLQARYTDAATLLPATVEGGWPEFGQVLKRVEESQELL